MKKVGVCILALLFLMPLVIAIDIHVKTLPGHKIDLFIRDVGKKASADSIINKDTGAGEVLITSSVSLSQVDLRVKLKKEGVAILNEEFESVDTSTDIFIEFEPGKEIGIVDSFELKTEEENVKIEENQTEELSGTVANEEPVEEQENIQEISAGMTGAVISNIKGIFTSKTAYYIIGGVFLVGVFFFILFISRKKISSGGGSFKVRKLSENNYDTRLSNAEKKLDEAKKELDNLRDRKKKLQEAREKFKRDQEELKKVESDY